MEKMTRKLIAILTVGALLFALPFAAAADVLDYPEQGVEEAAPAPADLPPPAEPEAAPAGEPAEGIPGEEPAEGIPGEEPAEGIPGEEALEEEAPEEDDPEEELPEEASEELATSDDEDDEPEEIAPLSTAELEFLIDMLQELRDEINWAISVIEFVGPDGFTPEQWAVFQHNLALWNAFQNEDLVITVNGAVVAQGFDEVFAWMLANWNSLSPAEQDAFLDLLVDDIIYMDGVIRPAFYTYLYILCDWPEDPDCTCPLCIECPNCGITLALCQNQCLTPPPVLCTVCGHPVANCTCLPIVGTACDDCGEYPCVCVSAPPPPPTTTVVTTVAATVAPLTGDTTSAQAPLVKLMISLFAISGLSLVKFRMRSR